jgi:isopenicillin N synthase-like dioxygenase
METIDISLLFEAAHAESVDRIAALISEQFRTLGFLYVCGVEQCVSTETIRRAFAAAQEFFTADEGVKATGYSKDRARYSYWLSASAHSTTYTWLHMHNKHNA